jgi:cation-transporting ATPase 13A2
MIELIKECRASLATNFSLFNIMSMYALIQYTTSWICQYYYAYPSDINFVYWDFVSNFLLLLTYGYISTADKLTKEKPLNSLFSFSNIFQILCMVAIQLIGQIVAI